MEPSKGHQPYVLDIKELRVLEKEAVREKSNKDNLAEKYRALLRKMNFFEKLTTDPKNADVAKRGLAQISKEVTASLGQLQSSQTQLNEKISEIAKKYRLLNKAPDEENPLYHDIKQMLLIQELRDYNKLPPYKQKEIDLIFKIDLDRLIKEANIRPGATPIPIDLKAMIQNNPDYVAARLSQIPLEEANNVVKMLFREPDKKDLHQLDNQDLLKLAKSLIPLAYEKVRDKATFLRESDFTGLFLAEFQKKDLELIFIGAIYNVHENMKNKLGADQQAIGKNIVTFLEDLKKMISIKTISPEMKEIYQTISKLDPAIGNKIATSLLFLRYLCPALIQIDPEANPGLHQATVLMSRVIILMVNGTTSKDPLITNLLNDPRVKDSAALIPEITRLLTS